jgi:hypothetical protein
MLLSTGRLALVSLLGLTASIAVASDRDFDQRFIAAQGSHFVLDTDEGSVTIVGHDSRDLIIHADISGTEDFKVTAQQSSSGVTVLGRSHFHWYNILFNYSSVHFRVQVPRDVALELKSSGGRLEVSGVSAGVQGSTSGGRIELRDVAGNIDMHTSGGGIDAENLRGSTRMRTSGGSIDINHVVGDLEVHTSGGHVELGDIDGKINADTSGGHVRVEARSNHGISLSSSGGKVTLLLPADVRASIDARTGGGRVHTDFPVTVGELSDDSAYLRGQINGGGDPVTLHSSGGGIYIEKLP